MDAQAIISNLVDVLKQVDGVQALVLGGSRAKGTHHPGSDIDIGIYYDPDQGLDLAQLRRAASDLDDGHRDNVMTDIGGWGSWINGGGWLQVKQMLRLIFYTATSAKCPKSWSNAMPDISRSTISRDIPMVSLMRFMQLKPHYARCYGIHRGLLVK